MDLREQKFGIEIELTGLTRKRAAEVIGKYLGQEPHYDGGYYEEIQSGFIVGNSLLTADGFLAQEKAILKRILL